MKAMLNVLQDEGFIVNNANPILGFISGSKDFSFNDKTINIYKDFGILMTLKNYQRVLNFLTVSIEQIDRVF